MKTEVQRNYLEIDSLKNLFPAIKPNNFCKIQLVHPPDFQLNKFFYKQIGKNYRWIDSLHWELK